MQAEEQIQSIRTQIQNCQECPLFVGRFKSVPGEGPATSQIMFIGEGPGYNENEQGKPFVGQAGKFLDELLAHAGLARSEVFITNVVKCRPPNNRDPEPAELSACRKYLDAQIETINPSVIVTLGRFSMARFINNGKISQIHGYPRKVDGRTIVTMYHPAAALHQPDLRQPLLDDFARLRKLLNQPSEVQSLQTAPEPPKVNEEKPPEQLSLF
ncbi:MAG: uracil-DNA glycosylase [Anaerolineaceae bacterium]